MTTAYFHLPLEIVNQVVRGHAEIRPDGGRAFKLSKQRIAALPPRKLPEFYHDGSALVMLPINENRRLDMVVRPGPCATTYRVIERHRKMHRGRNFFVMDPAFGLVAFTGRCVVTDTYAECQWFVAVERKVLNYLSQRYPADPTAEIPAPESHTIYTTRTIAK